MPMRKTSYWRDPTIAERRNRELERALPTEAQKPRKGPKERLALNATVGAAGGTERGDSDRQNGDLRQS
jgi:hypothetical protein